MYLSWGVALVGFSQKQTLGSGFESKELVVWGATPGEVGGTGKVMQPTEESR